MAIVRSTVKQRMLMVDGVNCFYRAEIKPISHEVTLTLKNTRGTKIAKAVIFRHLHLEFTVYGSKSKKAETKKLADISKDRNPEVYITDVAMWLLKKGAKNATR